MGREMPATWMESSAAPNAGMSRPRPSPRAMAARIQTAR